MMEINPNSIILNPRNLLKKHNLADLIKVPISGILNAIKIAQIHAIDSDFDVNASIRFSETEKILHNESLK
jgi:hypothetical protein